MILVVFVGIWVYNFLKEKYIQQINEKYEQETKNMSEDDLKIINEVIYLAKEREGQEYTWGGKGEIITKERLEELVSYYGESYYPLDKKDYIGKQGFDCSGLTYWTYKTIINVNIGYSTTEQKAVLKDYKVQMKNIQPGDLIFTPGHVVMYIGKGKIINSANRNPYPVGGIKIESALPYKNGQAYRPIDYINAYLK
ncbi:C40 family peptidase [Terrisporobacter mayombei]|uniref:C40 family peptidase n=1 Tax=Terrisporobacter mayombei TaxID=1541 RepID=UPI001D16CE1E|nr:NlpC/P60 family protein [Terrisporobacter mayombei]